MYKVLSDQPASHFEEAYQPHQVLNSEFTKFKENKQPKTSATKILLKMFLNVRYGLLGVLSWCTKDVS